MDWFIFIIKGLCIWRITHLCSAENGPFDIIITIRKWLGQGFFGSLLDCFYCLSIWISLPFAIWKGEDWSQIFLLWFALSGFACLLEQTTSKQ